MENSKWSGDQMFIRDSSWDGTKLSFEKDRDYGFSWPQRNYKCSFCKREFKSAQALGGHMNVHRRDRARMRLSSPSLTDSPNPNPNPSFSSSPSSSKFLPNDKITCHSSLSCVSNPPSAASLDKELHLGLDPIETMSTKELSSKEYDFSFEKVPLNFDCSQPREICGGERGKKNKEVTLEVARGNDARISKVNEFVRLDLGIGFVGDAKDHQDLDLELRLGYC